MSSDNLRDELQELREQITPEERQLLTAIWRRYRPALKLRRWRLFARLRGPTASIWENISRPKRLAGSAYRVETTNTRGF